MTGQIIQLGRSDSITDVERPWVEALEVLGERAVRGQLMDRGMPPTVSACVTFWLVDQSEHVRRFTAPTVSKYRRVLTTIGPPKIPGSLKTSRNAQLELPLEVAG